jgi:hypothetical protein
MSESIDLTNYNPDEIPEGEIHPAGTEVEARISRVAKDIDKNNTPYLMPWFEDPQNANIEDFNDYIPLPTSEDSEKDKGKKLRKLKAFGEAFDIDFFGAPISMEEMKGRIGWLIVGVGESQDGNPQNSVKKYVVQG